jgi:membrane-anchored protein YejM (alkaline phosphatase superfamily)
MFKKINKLFRKENSLKRIDDNFLLITLDSCRFDSFVQSKAPIMKSVGKIHKAYSNGNFTYSSHAAIFMGFTPGDPAQHESFVNPKFGKIFKLKNAGFTAMGINKIILDGKNIIDGFNRIGYTSIGTAAMNWFNPNTKTGKTLTQDFQHFFFSKTDIEKQVEFVLNKIKTSESPTFVFMNIGETHVPYWHRGADWDKSYNPCIPFSKDNSREECQRRQIACIEFIDDKIKPLIDMFNNDNIVITSDHGDCWGEDGLWEHGIHHEMTVTVPLVFRINGLTKNEN